MRNLLLVLLITFIPSVALSKVHSNIDAGSYAEYQKLDLRDFKGKMSFLSFMKEKAYPMISEQASHMGAGDHLNNIRQGKGVEIKLGSDVTTYHVKFKHPSADKAERSGRSFSAVGNGVKTGGKIDYVADASYKHYLTTLEKYLDKNNDAAAEKLFKVIIGVVVNCDASGIEDLNKYGKEVAADFVAVYVAEQYRRLIGGRGNITSRHAWDDAHLQVTLLAAFHSGQTGHNRKMFYEGQFTNEVYHQIYRKGATKQCVYKDRDNRGRKSLKKRDINLTDYWQFNRECQRSGVNMTRRDFEDLGWAISNWYKDQPGAPNYHSAKSQIRKNKGNIFEDFAESFISNSAPSLTANSYDLVNAMTDFLMDTRRDANKITGEITGIQGRDGVEIELQVFADVDLTWEFSSEDDLGDDYGPSPLWQPAQWIEDAEMDMQ